MKNIEKCNFRAYTLPKLDNIYPTLESNLAKMTKELGRVAESVGKHRNMNGEARDVDYEKVIFNIVMRTFALMQTCNTVLDIVKNLYPIDIEYLFSQHIYKLSAKRGYITMDAIEEYPKMKYSIPDSEYYRYVVLPNLNILTPSIESNMIKMMEELGEISEHIENYLEKNFDSEKECYDELIGLTEETLDLMQTCNTMLNSISIKENVVVEDILVHHINKLFKKGYITKNTLEEINRIL